MKLLLHIGMPKCGSSALQAYLSSSVFFEAAKEKRVAYVALHEAGQLKQRHELISLATVSAHDYVTSHSGHSISGFGKLECKKLKAQFTALAADYDVLVMSNEGWGPHPADFAENILFADEMFEVSLLVYVRPQIEWMNSAWWQWGAWSDVPVDRWVNRNTSKALWHSLLEQWAQKPWVKKIDVRQVADDVVADFQSYLGIPVSSGNRFNQSLPSAVLRIFQHNRKLRPGPHDSAIEFALARQLTLEASKTPWILRPPVVKRLLEFFREDNKKLAEWLPPEKRDQMLQDSRWWDPEAYASKTVSPPFVDQLNPDELEAVSVAALEAVNRLDGEVRRLRQQLDACTKKSH